MDWRKLKPTREDFKMGRDEAIYTGIICLALALTLVGIQYLYYDYIVICYGTGQPTSYWDMPVGNYTNVICTDNMNESKAYGYLNKLIEQKYPGITQIQVGGNYSIYPIANNVEVSCIILKQLIGGC